MKKIEAVVRRDKFQEVYDVLEESGIGGMTISPAEGFGRHRNGLRPKVKIEIYADEFQTERVVDLIRRAAKTGESGDGKIAIIPLDGLYRIRTGEKGANAI